LSANSDLTVESIDEVIKKQIAYIRKYPSIGVTSENDLFLDSIDEKALSEAACEHSKSHKFKHLLNKLILSCSPFVKYTLPYLLSDQGLNQCSLGKYLASIQTDRYDTDMFMNLKSLSEHNWRLKKTKKEAKKANETTDDSNGFSDEWPYKYEKQVVGPHAFLNMHLTRSLNDQDIRVSRFEFDLKRVFFSFGLFNRKVMRTTNAVASVFT
jgi:hypothetical protein